MASKKPSAPTPLLTVPLNPNVSFCPAMPMGNIVARPGANPNVMSDAQFGALVHSIRHNGFLQPVAVRQDETGRYEIIDGHHRWRAAAEANIKAIPAMILTSDYAQSIVDMLSLNRLKGEMNLSVVSDLLKDLTAAAFPDLTLTGFNGGEIQSLLDMSSKSVTDGIEDIGENAGADESPNEPVEQGKRYAIRMVFDRPEDRDLVKSVALRFGVTVDAGVLELCRAQD